jgi:TolB protein
MKKLLFSIFFCQFFVHSKAQNQVGFFENHVDIGLVINKGNAIYDNASKVYSLTGSGENIWFKKDELHFAYKKIKGDFIVTTQPNLVGKGTDPHRKSGWMVRTSTDTSAAMVCLTVHGDGLTAFQYRKKNGINIEEIKIPITGGDILQLERRGRSYFIFVSKLSIPFWTVEVPDFDFPEELLVGLFICSHNKNVVETGTFTNTRIFTAVK